MDDTDQQEPGRTGRAWSVRTRVLALMLSLMVSGLLVAGAVTFSVQFAELHDRIERDLLQEVDELDSLARAGPEGPAADGSLRPYTDLDTVFRSYLQSSVPGQSESVVALIDGEPTLVSGGERPFELDRPEVVSAALAVHQEGRSVFTDTELDGRQLRLIVTSVQLPEEARQGIFVVGIDIGTLRGRIVDDMTTYALVALGTIVLTGLAGHLVAGRLLRPLIELREATSAINAEDLTRRVEVSDADTDVAQLSRTFNQMLDRLEAGFADQRRFLDDAAHELRTPLTIIRGNLELVAADDPRDVEQTRELVLDEMDRMQRLVNDLLLLASAQRPDFVRRGPVDVAVLGDEVMDRVNLLGERDFVRAGWPTGTVRADRQRLQQAVVQLAANAVKFTSPGDTVTVGLSWSPATSEVRDRVGTPAEEYLVVSVQDTGVGIEPDQMERIFERFSRADNARHLDGSGLGLAIVMAIARAHQGTVTLDSQVGIGSTFRVWIPRSRSSVTSGRRSVRLDGESAPAEPDRERRGVKLAP